MSDPGGPADLESAHDLADLGTPPRDVRDRATWLRKRFVDLGVVWYSLGGSDNSRRQREIEDLAVALLVEHRDVCPSLSTLKRAVANWSFLPSTVEAIWARAFPPSVADRAQATAEWTVLLRTGTRVADLQRSDNTRDAEALRTAAVSYFNKYLPPDDVGLWLRAEARKRLRKL